MNAQHKEDYEELRARFDKYRSAEEHNLQERDERIKKLQKEQKVLEQRIKLLMQMGNNPNMAGQPSHLTENGDSGLSMSLDTVKGGGQKNKGKHKLGEGESGGEEKEGEEGSPSSSSAEVGHMLYYDQMKREFKSEVDRLKATINELTDALNESEARIKLHLLQEKVLKDEIREMERTTKREVTDIE